MDIRSLMEAVGLAIDAAGVAVILVGAIAATVRFSIGIGRRQSAGQAYRDYRRWLARSILIGLEFLIAGDIIRTVVIEPTFEGVGVLASIVLIRTFLSVSLEIELTGRWLWSRRPVRDEA